MCRVTDRRRGYNRTVSDSRRRAPTGVSPATRRVRIRWAVVAVVLFVAIVGWAVPVAATEKIAGQPSPAEPAADVFLSGVHDAPRRRRGPVDVVVARGHRAGAAGRVGEQRHGPHELRVEHQGVDRGRLPAGGAGRGPGGHGGRAGRHRRHGAQQRQRGRTAAVRGARRRRDPAPPAFGLRRDGLDRDPGLLVADPDHGGGRHADLRVRPAHRAGVPGRERSPDRPAERRPGRRLRDQGGRCRPRRRCRSRTGGCRTRRRRGSGT